jgi:hypothetical protein
VNKIISIKYLKMTFLVKMDKNSGLPGILWGNKVNWEFPVGELGGHGRTNFQFNGRLGSIWGMGKETNKTDK